MRNKARTNLEVRGMKMGQILQLPRGSAQRRASPEQLPPSTCAPPSEVTKEGLTGIPDVLVSPAEHEPGSLGQRSLS